MNPLLVRPDEDVFGGLLAGMTPKEAGDLAKPGLEYAGGLLDNIAEKAPGSLGRAWQGSDIRRMAQDALNTASYYAGPHLSDRAAAIPAAAAAATENMFGNKDAREASTAFKEGKVGQGAKLLGLGSASALLDVPSLGTGSGLARGLLRGLTKAAHYTPDLSMAVAPIKAFHGSPFDFEKFDLKKIGTGEGAQAYGHGLYFAGNENVARQYRDALTASNLKPDSPEGIASSMLRATGGDKAKAIDLLGQDIKRFGSDPRSSPDITAAKVAAIDALQSGKPLGGRMYEVGIHADPEKLLDLDKSLSGQPRVLDALSQVFPPKRSVFRRPDKAGQDRMTPNPLLRDMTPTGLVKGDVALRELTSRLSPEGAAQTLRDAGVPGVKYLDQGSRGAGEGSRNYVTFSDDIVEILRKYGLAGAGVGLGGAMAMQPGLFPLPQQQ